MGLLIAIGLLATASLFAGVYSDHRQIRRQRRRALLAITTATVHRHNLEEGWKAIGGSGGRR